MIAIIYLYLSSLLKRLITLIFLSSFIPLFLFALNYPLEVGISIFLDSFYITLPWGIIFQQSFFCGLYFPAKKIPQIQMIILSTLLSTLILMAIMPLTQVYMPIQLSSIKSNIIMPKSQIIPTKKGTLIIDPATLPESERIFSPPKAKAIWIDLNYIIFQDITTNENAFVLSEPQLLNSLGYSVKKGQKIIPFPSSFPSFAHYRFAQIIIQTWFDQASLFSKNLGDLYRTLGIKYHLRKNPMLSQIYIKSKFQNKQQHSNIKKNLSETAQILKSYASKNSHKEKIYIYTYIFMSILTIILIATLFGLLLGIKQTLLGAMALILIASIYIPLYISSMISITLKLHTILNWYSLLMINLLIVGILYFCCFIAIAIRNIIGAKKYG